MPAAMESVRAAGLAAVMANGVRDRPQEREWPEEEEEREDSGKAMEAKRRRRRRGRRGLSFWGEEVMTGGLAFYFVFKM